MSVAKAKSPPVRGSRIVSTKLAWEIISLRDSRDGDQHQPRPRPKGTAEISDGVSAGPGAGRAPGWPANRRCGRAADAGGCLAPAFPASLNPRQHANPSFCLRHRPDLLHRDEVLQEEMEVREALATVDAGARSSISSIWELYSALPARHRSLLLRGLLQQSCLPQLSFLAHALNTLLRIDFLAIAPRELSLKILSYLDAKSLCRAASVSRAWKRLADDDVIWHIMCEQHIDKKCAKCGWGLPLLDITKFRNRPRRGSLSCGPSGQDGSYSDADGSGGRSKRKYSDDDRSDNECSIAIKRRSTDSDQSSSASPPTHPLTHVSPSHHSSLDSPEHHIRYDYFRTHIGSPNVERLNAFSSPAGPADGLPPLGPCGHLGPLEDVPHHPSSHRPAPRPWKEIYAERYAVERNWRTGTYRFRSLPGHVGGLTALHMDDEHDRLVTGGADGYVRLWNPETGKLVQEWNAHAGKTVRSVQIDGPRIWSAGMDGWVRVWDPKKPTGPVRELSAHDGGGVTSMHVDGLRLLTGHEDGKVLHWNLRTAHALKLSGHTDWVNCVRFHGKTDVAFSASDDRTVRMWDLAARQCVRVFSGDNNAVQCVRASPPPADPHALVRMVSSGDDNTVRVWNASTGQLVRTIFGHMEGVWSVWFDSLRVVSGGLGGRVRVWDTEDGHELLTLDPSKDAEEAEAAGGGDGHAQPHPLPQVDGEEQAIRGRSIYAVQSTDTKIVAGGEDGRVWIYDFGESLDWELRAGL
ncbi:WD40-repeat-containing domain protein [Hyaloraphidium curvatum]|nr:WD40-repeat-containing domain protein [Hyaloraphidium curvatum]